MSADTAMPYPQFRLSAIALVLLTGCAAPGFFATSFGSKATAESAASSGPRASSFSNSWSGTLNADRGSQDYGAAGAAGAAAENNERRIRELQLAGERSQKTGDRRAARIAFDQVLRLAPGDVYANYQLAKMDDDERRFADAERHYFTVLKQTPNDPDILSSLGWSYYLQGRYDDSDRMLREALRYNPNHQIALYNLGWLYGTRGDYDGALTIFRSAGSEADAQQALASLKEGAAGAPVADLQYANAPMSANVPATENAAGAPAKSQFLSSGLASGITPVAEQENANPEARKFAADYKRLKAEHQKQQQKQQQDRQARLAQKAISAPSPWNNNRQGSANAGQRDSGQTMRVAGQTEFAPFVTRGPQDGPANPIQNNGRYPDRDAAFPGAAPSQANRPRVADPTDLGPAGNPAMSVGAAPVILTPGAQAIPGIQAVHEQTATVQGQSTSPIITPAGESHAGREGNSRSWNSLPSDDALRLNASVGNHLPAINRVPEWPRNGAGNPVSTDPSPRYSGGHAAATGQFNSGPPRDRNSRQDAQTTAAQLGLSAGASGLGFPAAEWPTSSAAQSVGTGSGQNLPGGTNLPASQNSILPQSSSQQPSIGGMSQGLAPAAPTSTGSSSTGSSSLPAWPSRPLSGGSIPQAVVPSAQGVVYGSSGDSGLPNFNSVRPAAQPTR